MLSVSCESDDISLLELQGEKKSCLEDSFNASYTEDLEPLDDNDDHDDDSATNNDSRSASPKRRSTSPKRPKRRPVRRVKSDPDHRWEDNSKNDDAPPHRWEVMGAAKDDSNVPSSDADSKEKSRRSKFKRANSVDVLSVGPRHSWDGGSRVKSKKPDFRWDKFVEAELSDDNSNENNNETSDKSLSASSNDARTAMTASPRRRPPRRTRSAAANFERPLLTRSNSKVRFCLGNNDCIEVPRIAKDMKRDLFYTKKEIKVFKAEKKEEKKEAKERRREEKERQKEQKEDPPGNSFANPAGNTAIASAC
ncbi:expressed unknown protein [Seminavis robusta]|uniref:Uncharacterized protein n=1 Tax=Seminavis robusta TaxID=568900 RepID=A0A9N8EWX5_9STRA|nr:expressed unknown protein [Seminavis robusta]|eukprot:Sro1937_g306440.1 n/a (308) ;mRNA; r:7430-8353